uniref:Uncharacterized protein n=1 Tax=Cannabis sativa TaxID=3483 RepID=A0A803PRN4_CANSA
MVVDQLLEERDAFLDDLKMHLLRAQHKMKKTTDLHRQEVHFEGVHPVCHVSQRRAVVGATSSSPTFPPQLTPELELQVEPNNVLNVRHGPNSSGQGSRHWGNVRTEVRFTYAKRGKNATAQG